MKGSPANFWLFAAVAAPIVYVVAVALGGVLTPGYSQTAGPIGALTMNGAPATLVLVPLFALYNALLAAFALTVRDGFQRIGVRLSLLTPVFLLVVAIMGTGTLVYPMDPTGLPSTETGRLHAFFSGVATLSTMIAVLFAALSLGRSPQWRGFRLYSFASLVAIVVAGAWAASTAADASPLMGLAERLTIGAFPAVGVRPVGSAGVGLGGRTRAYFTRYLGL